MSVIWLQIEFWSDVIFAIIGAVCGWIHSGRIIRKYPSVDLENVHRRMGMGLWVMAVILLGVIILSIIGFFRPLAWSIPLWLELLYPFLKWGGIMFVFSYLSALSIRIAWHSKNAERGKMAFAMLGLIAAFLTLRWMQNKSIADELFEIKDGEIVLQSSGYSCVPASISNILGKFGIKESEKQLAAEMGTTMSGTTDGRVAFLMLKYKIRTKRLKNASITDVHPPAALIVDHPATGPESHMVAFMAMHDGQAEIWDPVQGRVMLTPKDLAAVWHGKALEFDRK